MPYTRQSFINGLRANSLIRHELRRRKPRFRLFKWAFGISLVVGIINIFAALVVGTPAHIISYVVFAGLIVISIPPYIASSAVETTYSHLQPKNFDLLRVTALSNVDILKGYIFCALYRHRILLSFIASLIPLVVIGLTFFGSYENFYRCLGSSRISEDCASHLPGFGDVATWFFISVTLVCTVMSIHLLAATVGTAAMLWGRHYLIAKLTAIAMLLIAIGVMLVAILSPFHDPEFSTISLIFIVSVLSTLVVGSLSLRSIRNEKTARML